MDKNKTIEIDGARFEIPNYTPERLALSQAINVFEDNIMDIKEACQLNVLHIMRDNPKIVPSGDENVDSIYEGLREIKIKQGVEGYQKTLKRIKSRDYARRNPHRSRITDEMIQTAREYPIADMYDGHLKGGEDRRQFGLCPFHSERTSSFCIHADNRWSCFGSCNEHGDSISFFIKLHGLTGPEAFIQAVKALQ